MVQVSSSVIRNFTSSIPEAPHPCRIYLSKSAPCPLLYQEPSSTPCCRAVLSGLPEEFLPFPTPFHQIPALPFPEKWQIRSPLLKALHRLRKATGNPLQRKHSFLLNMTKHSRVRRQELFLSREARDRLCFQAEFAMCT